MPIEANVISDQSGFLMVHLEQQVDLVLQLSSSVVDTLNFQFHRVEDDCGSYFEYDLYFNQEEICLRCDQTFIYSFIK